MTRRTPRRRWRRRRLDWRTRPPARDDKGSSLADQPGRRNSALVATGILLSRTTGLVRERTIGHFLGTSFAADAFTAAFRIPNLLQHLLGEGVLSASFIPVYSRLLAEGRHRQASRLVGAVAGILAATGGALALIGILFAEPLTVVIAPGLQGRTFELTVSLVRIMFPGVAFLVLSAWCLGVLNSHRRFLLPYAAPMVLNVAQIGALVGAGLTVLSSDDGGPAPATLVALATWLAVGTLIGGVAQFLVQLPAVLRLEPGLRPSLRTDFPEVRTTLRAFAPVVTARGVVQVSSYVQVFLASFLAAGALATLRYAQILYMLPISLFAMSVAAAELPELSSAPEDRAGMTTRVQAGLARIAALVVPTALGYLVVGDLVTAALFQTGAFGPLDSIAVWVVLSGYALGLLATTSSRLLQSALYGIGDTRTPARIAAARVLVSVALGVLLMMQLDRVAVTATGVELLGSLPALGTVSDAARSGSGGEEVLRLGAAGLSLGSGIAAWLEYVMLRRAVGHTIGPTQLAGGHLGPVLVAASMAAVVAGIGRPGVAELHPLIGGTLVVGGMVAAYMAAASALGVSEIQDVLSGFRRRLTKR